MTELHAHWMDKLYGENIYTGYVPEYPLDAGGWAGDGEVFRQVFAEFSPSVVIEVGTWKGASAFYMAEAMGGRNGVIVCVDTWLGSLEMWRYPDLHMKHGHPGLYWQFLSNVVHAGKQEILLPVQLPGTIAARVLEQRGFIADMVYIDGSHDYRDVKADLESYWPLLKSGGALLGDDYNNCEVKQAADEFLVSVHANIRLPTQGMYLMVKP
jgi:hypothetical protein